jgi:Endonuclease NucS
MPIKHTIWKIAKQPEPLLEVAIASEQQLEEMISARPAILSDDWMLIGRQESTELGGRVDLLALAPDASVVLIELKRNQTPREVVAQAIDYASWVERLKPEQIAAIYGRFANGRSLKDDFRTRFGHDLDEESLNETHQIVVVASSLDSSTERIVQYLNDREISINVLHFQVFQSGTEQLLSRAWLIDPVEAQVAAAATKSDRPSEPWNGEFYSSFGHGESRSWEEARQFGFISGGGARWYNQTLQLLKPGDLVWVKIPGAGFVGVGKVTADAVPASKFLVGTQKDEVHFMALAEADYHREFIDDPEKCEWFVPVKWLDTVPIEKAVQEVGMFGNQNTVCRPTTPLWRSTVERLKKHFTGWNAN